MLFLVEELLMRWRLFFLLAIMSGLQAIPHSVPQEVPATAFQIDTIRAVVFSQGGTQIITDSDVSRPTLSGAPQSLDDIIFERLVLLNAAKFNIMPDDDAVDKYLAIVQKENNLTLEELKKVFASAGYDYEEGRQKFKEMQAVNAMIDYKIKSKLIVPQTQVENYHQQNPVITEATATVRYGFIPYDTKNTELQKKALAYMKKTGKELRGIKWNEPFSIKSSETTEDKQYLFSLAAGQISPAKDTGRGYEVFRIIDATPRHEVSLEERYKEIADMLRKPLFEELLNSYKKSLFDVASVLYFQKPLLAP